MASYSVVDPHSPEIWIEVLNPLANSIHLTQGQPVAVIESENAEFSATDLFRDLSKMPSDLGEGKDSEDFFDGFQTVVNDKEGEEIILLENKHRSRRF